MKSKIKRWSVWACGLIAAICLAVGGVKAVVSQEPSVTASAAGTSYTITKVEWTQNHDATKFYMNATSSGVTQFNNSDDWTTEFVLVKGTGSGFALNGKPFAPAELKQPGEATSFFVSLGFTPSNGDVLTIDGTFESKAEGKLRDVNFVFQSCALTYNTSTSSWSTWTGTILKPQVTGGTSSAIQFSRLSSLGSLSKGEGLTINGTKANISSIGNNKLTLSKSVTAGSVVKLSGIYASGNSKYACVDLYYRWDGSSWSELADYNDVYSDIISNAQISGSAANGFYIALNLNLGVSDWDNAMSPTSSAKLTMNGKALSNGKIKLVGYNVYVDLGTAAKNGDTLIIDGEYTYGICKVLFVPHQVLQYNGSTWTLLSGTTYDLGGMHVASGNTTTLTLTNGSALPVTDNATFTKEGGDGFFINGTSENVTVKSTNAGLQLSFTAVKSGDVISFGGIYYNSSKQVRYIVANTYYKWDGSTWTEGAPYYTQSVENIQLGNMDGYNFFIQLNGSLVFDGWQAMSLESGEGITLNSKPLTNAEVKLTGSSVYVDLHSDSVNVGDILTIKGMYIYVQDGVTAELTFATMQVLKYNGTAWVASTETLTELGALSVHPNSAPNGNAVMADQLYTMRADGGDLPVQNWEVIFTYECGDGVKVNNVPVTPTMKSTNAGLWFGFEEGTIKNGDVVTISGMYVCSEAGARYVIEDSAVWWIDGAWASYNYTTQYVGKVSIANGDSSSVHFARENGSEFAVGGSWDEKIKFIAGSGNGVTLTNKTLTLDMARPSTLYVGLGTTAQAGDVLTIGGKFYSTQTNTIYSITQSTFMWSGAAWIIAYAENELMPYDTVSLVELGAGLTVQGNNYDGAGLRYQASNENTTGSVKFRFDYRSSNTSAGCIDLRLRGGAWEGVHFRLVNGGVEFKEEGVYTLKNDTDYRIELGAISATDGKVWAYIMVDGVIVKSKALSDCAFNQSSVSIYVSNVADGTVLSDPDHVSVSYGDSLVEYVVKNDGDYTLADVAMGDLFIAWGLNGELYYAGSALAIGEENVVLTAVEMDFKLKSGAAIRLASTSDESGIRFTSMMNTADMALLESYGISIQEVGTLIMPNDYLGENQAPNLADFTAGSTILRIPNTVYRENIGDYTVYYGAMKTIKTKNYARDFAGRGYMCITLPNGEERILYTPFSLENVRSVRTVAQAFRADETEPEEGEIRYYTISAARQAIVDMYADSLDYGTNAVAASVKTPLARMEEGYEAAYVVNSLGKKYNKTSSETWEKE